MKKGLKSLFILVNIFLVTSFGLTLVLADFNLGNESYNIDKSYGFNEPITGWINISLQDEPADSLLSLFSKEISILDFLDLNNADYTCFPADCESAYSTKGSSKSSEILRLDYLEETLLGIVIKDNITKVNSLSFDVATDAEESCSHPLRIEVADKAVKWVPKNISTKSTCGNPSQGCFNPLDSTDTTKLNKDQIYCNKIEIPAMKAFKIGANIQGSGNAQFTLYIDAGSESGSKVVTVTQGGEISTIINFDYDLPSIVEADVCLEVDNLNGNTYRMKYETINPCSYSDDSQSNHYEDSDFDIFIVPLKYGTISDFTFEQSLFDDEGSDYLATTLGNYLSNKYDYNCDPECIIPIKFISGARFEQEVSITNIVFEYSKGSITPSPIERVYELEATEIILDSNFQKLYLDDTNFLTPNSSGNKTAELLLGGKTVFEDHVQVSALPVIKSLFPDNAPALVPSLFIVLLEGDSNNLTYTWDFGDGTSETNNENNMEHIYAEMGDYQLTVKIENEFGESTKTISVNVKSPQDFINETIANHRADLSSIKMQINDIPSWIKTKIEAKLDLDNLESEIDSQEDKFKSTFSDDSTGFFNIMQKLLSLKIPYNIHKNAVGPLDFYVRENQLDFGAFEILGAGNEERPREEYTGGVNSWINEELDTKLKIETYSSDFRTGEEKELLYNHIKLDFTPKKDTGIGNLYVVINDDINNLVFKGDLGAKSVSSSTGFVLDSFNQQKTIEFLYPSSIEMADAPVFITPRFSDIQVDENITCNANKKCEKSRGEDWKNCRVDCKPIGWTVLMILIVLFGAFVVYITLQEWYKRHYEKHLFPDRNQLFNLINFMNNSQNQGLRRSEIFSKLSDMDWSNEQLNYAWNKFKGKRTGMWEIPIFKWVEKRKVKKEIQKRQIVQKVKSNIKQNPRGRYKF